MQDHNVECYTYQLKQESKFRIVINNIHYTVDKEEFKRELERQGYIVCNIHPSTSKRTNKSLSMHFVD